MALETATPSAQVVGNAFVEQYYHILYNSPELAHRFYHDSSVLSRPDSNGVMTSVTTMQGINEKILSLDYKNCKAEINTADAQKSYKEGVTVLVTGYLMGKDNLKRNFAQSFFLAPQDNGYFVLNDVFRYVEDGESLENQKVNGVYDAPGVPSSAEHEPTQGMDPSATDATAALVEENQNVAEQVSEQLDQERQLELVNEKETLSVSQSHSENNDIPVVESASSAQEDTPKKSYASIVKVPKGSSGPTRVYVPTNSSRVMPQKTESQPPVSPAPAPPEASAPSSIDAPESNEIPEKVEGHSIYIKNLPFNVIPAQLEQEFKKFGPIKQGGVQVRNNKQQGYCFGFVEFLSWSSMNDAIQASPITIGDRQAVVEIKRTSTRGSFPTRRGGFRSDSFRGRGNYVVNRSFVRNDYGNHGEFPGRPRGSAWRGRGGRSSGAKQTPSNSNPV
ncbi:nuclear transport factor 2-like isoform X2 [Hibiscus syriacus]|uniref:nuclear transport factor 2-like isoform X2 n=1 Tax=Hibiscus syriacus TaxID=106335 RepID=UPI001924A844|nr:nuclear transport factor 2-like isoform X2 [Hibiscus syriacus]